MDNELDLEEREILEAFERGEMRSVAGGEEQIAAARRERVSWRDHITVDPEVCHGRACITGTWVLVETPAVMI